MSLDEVERLDGFELGLQHDARPEDLVQGGEERDPAVIPRPAHQVDVGLGELEDGDDLQDVGDVDTVRPPRPLGVAGGA